MREVTDENEYRGDKDINYNYNVFDHPEDNRIFNDWKNDEKLIEEM